MESLQVSAVPTGLARLRSQTQDARPRKSLRALVLGYYRFSLRETDHL